MSEATAPETAAKKDEYIVQTKQVIESWDYPKATTGKTLPDGTPEVVIVPKSSPAKVTKIIQGQFGPFTNRNTAEVLCQQLGLNGNAFSAQIFKLVDGPEAETQVPPSPEVVAQMIKDGKFPGVPADAAVKSGDEPDNTIPFPSPSTAPETEPAPEKE